MELHLVRLRGQTCFMTDYSRASCTCINWSQREIDCRTAWNSCAVVPRHRTNQWTNSCELLLLFSQKAVKLPYIESNFQQTSSWLIFGSPKTTFWCAKWSELEWNLWYTLRCYLHARTIAHVPFSKLHPFRQVLPYVFATHPRPFSSSETTCVRSLTESVALKQNLSFCEENLIF